MKSVYIKSSVPEKLCKEQFKIPENVMMENAASALEEAVFSFFKDNIVPNVFIICGNGNNGGDGYALARRLFGKTEVYILSTAPAKTQEAEIQLECAKALGIPFLEKSDFLCRLKSQNNKPIIVDCIFGTGFHGELPENIQSLINELNAMNGHKIACDISSGLKFNADITVTMGAYKTALFSDNAKSVSGKIILGDLGIGNNAFERVYTPEAQLIEKIDVKLPWRNEKSSHKGVFGHFCAVAGEKAGAGIISATAGLNFGAGLVSLLTTKCSNIEQFKISPELMISSFSAIPAKTSAISIGSGLGNPSKESISHFINWFCNTKNPACVIDADLFSYSELPQLLKKLNSVPDARIILTPHLKEFVSLCTLCGLGDFKISELSGSIDLRMEVGKKLLEKFPNSVFVIKSANTLICSYNRGLSPLFYICADGTPSLSKAGSGDVLAGMCGALLAQGYSAQDAAITAVEVHALHGASFDEGSGFDLTPLKLIKCNNSVNIELSKL